jgi:hypothetical protein
MGRHNASHGRGGHHTNTHALTEPKWVDMGHGILQLRSNPNTHIKLAGGRRGAWQSVSLQDTRKVLQAEEAPPATLQAVQA